MIRLEVALPEGRSYPVLVGPQAAEELASVLPSGVQRVAVVTQPDIPVTVDPGVDHRIFPIPNGETAKTLSTIEELCRAFAAWGLTRGDAVVGVGGGVVTDVAGFTAASYHRGLPVVHVATTLLAQIDAAIGGKTGVNLPEGKNLVGAFWQPAAVLCDTSTLDTLPAREMRCGLGEMAKYHFLGGDDLADLAFDQQVARCVEIKADIVAADERDFQSGLAGGRIKLAADALDASQANINAGGDELVGRHRVEGPTHDRLANALVFDPVARGGRLAV